MNSNPINPQYRAALAVAASLIKEETKQRLQEFINEIIETEGSDTKTIELDNVIYTAIFIEERRVLCTLRAMPADMVNENVFPFESRIAVVKRTEEAKKIAVEDISERNISKRVAFLISKLAENVEYLISASGLVRYQLAMIEDHDPQAEPGETGTERVVLRGKSMEFYSVNTSFTKLFYTRTNVGLRTTNGRGFFVQVQGNLTPSLITNFEASIRTRNGVIKLKLPFIYMSPEDQARIPGDYDFREEVIERYINEHLVRTILNCVTADMLGYLTDTYRSFWAAITHDVGPKRKIHGSGIKNDFIDFTDADDKVVFSCLPYYNTTALECEVRVERGVSLNMNVNDPAMLQKELPETAQLVKTLGST